MGILQTFSSSHAILHDLAPCKILEREIVIWLHHLKIQIRLPIERPEMETLHNDSVTTLSIDP